MLCNQVQTRLKNGHSLFNGFICKKNYTSQITTGGHIFNNSNSQKKKHFSIFTMKTGVIC